MVLLKPRLQKQVHPFEYFDGTIKMRIQPFSCHGPMCTPCINHSEVTKAIDLAESIIITKKMEPGFLEFESTIK